ncbi:NF-kappa-B inhibitor zeta isoform X2 [Patella vulgata]|uniref:NF-kappa-B inhibitor zeta isoform X2 n=1 Tax=Patella vulgata TaxID=6465 RepID=UPI002180166D|nr:NF-kappa-B inhibitor zeta isoform X2 [Patella vulgata]
MSVEIEANTSTIIEKKYTMFLSHNHGRDINIKQEPVESSDSEENDKSESDLDDSEKLSAIMIKCKISSTESKILKENDDKKEDACEKEICSKLSKVTLKEKNDDGKDIEVIVENIKKEDECREKKRALGSNGLDTRGPTGGIPATFSQNQHIVQTQYQNGYSYSQSIPYYQQPQQNQYGGYDNNQYVNNMTNGKRRPEEDDETPYKYQAPNIVREAQAPQPVFLVNQGPLMNKQPAKRPIKPNYVPIRPKLDPVASKESQHSSPAHSPKSSELKSRVPATVTAAVKDNSTVQPVTNKKSPLPPSSTTCPSNNVVNTSSSSQSKKLNVARRHIAKLTSTDLRFQDDEGDTYLHAAVCKDSNNITDFVQALLERLEREKLIGMIDVFNVRRQTPLYCAVSANHPNIIEMMIRYGADVNTLAERMVHGGTVREVRAAIHVAASNGKEYLETLNALLKSRELNLNIANSDGQTALHCAILCHNKAKQDSIDCIDSTPIIETLIQHGADINAQDKKSGKTPLMYALESRSLHLIHTVVKQIKQDKMRMYLRTQSFDGNTPQKILESLKTVLDVNSWQKVHDMLMCSNKDINGFNIHQ